jgi:peptidyl-prolyl cis-trans isomerase D
LINKYKNLDNKQMATLQRIRDNAGILVSIVIGFALVAFILGDLLKSGKSIMGQSRTEVANIAGKSVHINAYQQKVDENLENYKRNYGQANLDASTVQRVQDQTWDQLVRELIMEDEYAEIGVGISSAELFDMVQGNNIAPQIQQIPVFQNPETGQFDRNRVMQFLKNLELDPSGNMKANWLAFEAALAQEKVNEKYNTIIEKGLYATTLEAKHLSADKAKSVDFEYVMVPYSTVEDSKVEVSASELTAYYNENIDKYEQEESRTINYVTFPVKASAEDIKAAEEWMVSLKAEFETTENDAQYVNLNSDVAATDNFIGEEDLKDNLKFLYNENKGTVYGPYRDGESFKLVKVSDIKNIPDSVKARHILIRAGQNNVPYAQAQVIADSLLAEVKKGADFAQLAKDNSEDGSAEEGGDLGWFTAGKMVKPFNDACFFGKKGDVVTIQSQFGVHVIEVLAQAKATKKIQLAEIVRNIEPSSKTYQDVYSQASQFGGNNRTVEAFRNAAVEKGYNLKLADLKRDDRNVANLDNPRQLVRWVYEAEQGQVSEIFEFSDVYVVAAVQKVKEEGTTPFEDVKADIEREVRKEKKAEYLMADVQTKSNGAGTLQSVAEKCNSQVKEAKNVSFGSYSISGVGIDYALQAALFNVEANKISSPLKGTNGVYVVQITNVQDKEANATIANDKSYLVRSLRSRVNYQAYNAVKEASDIDDKRSNFY